MNAETYCKSRKPPSTAEAREIRSDALESAQGYEINDHGLIVSPGKFVGEEWFVPYLWGRVLDGDAESVTDGEWTTDILKLDNDDREAFDLLPGIVAVELWESEQGYVYCNLLDAALLELATRAKVSACIAEGIGT